MASILTVSGLAIVALILLSIGVGAVALRARASRILRRAQRLMSSGEHQQALPLLTRAIALNPRIALAYTLRSQVLLRSGVVERALADADEAVRLAPNSHRSYLARARVYDYLGQYREAAQDLEAAIAHNPAWLSGYLELARYHLSLGDPERCLDVLERLTVRADAKDPLLYDALVIAGRVREESLCDVEGGIEAYSRAIALAPDRRVGYLKRGWALRAKGDYRRAAEDLLSAAQCPQRSEDLRLHHWLQAEPASWFETVARELGAGADDWMEVLQRILLEDADGALYLGARAPVQSAEPQIYLN